MKKKILTTVVALALNIPTLQANSNIAFGYASNDMNDVSKTSKGVYLSFDALAQTQEGFLLGVGGTMNTLKIAKYSAYTMGADLRSGYTLKPQFNIPLAFKVAAGYGVTRATIDNKNSWSPYYMLSADYTLYKGWGLGVAYQKTSATVNNVDLDIKSTILFLNRHF